MTDEWDHDGIERLRDAMARRVAAGDAVGLAWGLARRGEVVTGAAGVLHEGGARAVDEHTIFRISSMTKPVEIVNAISDRLSRE